MSPLKLILASTAVLAIGIPAYVILHNDVEKESTTANTLAKPDSDKNLSRQSSIPSESKPVKPIDDLASLKEEVSILRTEVSTLRRLVYTRAQANNPNSEAMAAEKDIRRDPVAKAEAESQRQKQMADVESNFKKERSDPKWSSRATSYVQNIMSNDDSTRSAMRNVECRSQTCRLEVADDGSGQMAKTMPLLAQRFSDTFPNITANQVDQGNGSSVTVLYLTRTTGQK